MVRSPAEARSTFDHLDDHKWISSAFACDCRARPISPSLSAPASIIRTLRVLCRLRERGWRHRCAARKDRPNVRHLGGLFHGREKTARTPRFGDRPGRCGRVHQAEVVAFETFSAQKADSLFERMARYETRSVPMLVNLRIAPDFKDCTRKWFKCCSGCRTRVWLSWRAAAVEPTGTHPGEQLHEELNCW